MTQNVEPTEGEWIYVYENLNDHTNDKENCVMCDGYYLASIYTSGASNAEEAKANAYCMAASKDMQRALSELIECFEAQINGKGGFAIEEVLDDARAAYEKSKVNP